MNKVLFGSTLMLLFIASCGKGEKEKTEMSEKTIPNVEVHDMKGLRIAYYNNDSLKLYFDYFKKEESIVKAKQTKFQKELERRQTEYQNYIIRNNEKLKNGLLSENEQMQIQQRAQQMEASIMQYQQETGSKLEKEMFDKLEVIAKKIQVYGEEYSKEHNIDILMVHGQGSQINFISDKLDVTKEFTAFLNEKQAEIEKDTKND